MKKNRSGLLLNYTGTHFLFFIFLKLQPKSLQPLLTLTQRDITGGTLSDFWWEPTLLWNIKHYGRCYRHRVVTKRYGPTLLITVSRPSLAVPLHSPRLIGYHSCNLSPTSKWRLIFVKSTLALGKQATTYLTKQKDSPLEDRFIDWATIVLWAAYASDGRSCFLGSFSWREIDYVCTCQTLIIEIIRQKWERDPVAELFVFLAGVRGKQISL